MLGPRRWVVPTFAALSLAGCNALFGIEMGQPKIRCADPLLIDDMEDGKSDICPTNGRHGYWYVASDGTSTNLTPGSDFGPASVPDGERGQSRFAARFAGSGFSGWGAAMGVSFTGEGLDTAVYDASAMSGVRFWMKSDVPVWVEALTRATVLPGHGGDCSDAMTATNCDNHFAFLISRPERGWAEYRVPYSALTQGGGSATWNPRELLGLQFRVGSGASFDVWIDDMSFYTCAASECVPTCRDPNAPLACPATGKAAAACRPEGTDCVAVSNLCRDALIIDNLEDGDAAICDSTGRYGSWFSDGDGTSADLEPAAGTTFTPSRVNDGSGEGGYAARLAGSGFEHWGALMGLTLRGGSHAYDASEFGGVKFRLKSTSPIHLSFPLRSTLPSSNGKGTCDPTNDDLPCNKSFHFPVTPPDGDWHEYAVPFASLTQFAAYDSGGNRVNGNTTWNSADIVSMNFAVPPEPDKKFDTWVDDVRFYGCTGDACLPTCSDPNLPTPCPARDDVPASCWPAGVHCEAPPDYVLYRVWGSGPEDVWAVGERRFGGSGVIHHFDGSTWSALPTKTTALWAVQGNDSRHVLAVGDYGTVLAGDGSPRWEASNVGSRASLYDAWSSAADDVFAIRYPNRILQWDGSAWRERASSDGDLRAIWGSGGTDVWAVGSGTSALHFDGKEWSKVSLGVEADLYAVWGNGPRDVWSAGDGADGATALVHFDGTEWTRISGVPLLFPNAIWGSAVDDIWLGGFPAGDGSTLLHFDGSVWQAFPVPFEAPILSLWGSASDDVWAAGTIGGRAWDRPSGALFHFDGSRWSAWPSGG
jgi:hypothetical protein